ncbi:MULTISPECIES: Trk system potassium transporter TrkA [Psychromonas]|uniref:Trk system potassium transporter TrkA n=1 Tax=Psychromonas TaxID=67572 RepID=UPI0025B1C26D|nr:Trk system potassium transporter TrkA [Psychromonas sp. 14N.309.X.WAT.B.A12]MDN2664787.1 Trk system potassium transporter TrkA [Psychromonas sp. 14N.309.X.WAT.B.A12]
MKIIILGAGQVGASLAENLVGENNDITVVDENHEALQELQDRFDLRVIQGSASCPTTLGNAGAVDADMLIAVTNSDEINMVACQIAFTLFNVPKKIARIRSQTVVMHEQELFNKDAFPIDHIIAPEKLVSDYIAQLIEYPGALQVANFANGKVGLVAIRAYYGGSLVGNAISALKEHMPNIEARVAAIFRRGKAIRPQGTTIIEADDEVFFITASPNIRAIMGEMQKLEHPYKRIMIVGGGYIGESLAKRLEKENSVKLIEKNFRRAEHLSETLSNTIVFCGDSSDQDLLLEEHIDQTDLFITVTNDDEANIMSAMLAKRLGARKAMVLIQRTAYVDLIQGNILDIAISPQQATLSALLTHVRKADLKHVYSLREGLAEAIEIVARGDNMTSKVVGKEISQLKLPKGTSVGAIVREEQVLIAHDDTVIETDDHVILFLVNKKYISDIEKLFQPSPFFL